MASGSSGVKTDALSSYGAATGQANNAYGTAAPIYQKMAQDPQGYTPQQMANLNTASRQTLGGTNAAAVGEGALASARTNSAGGYQAAIDDSARNAATQQSENALQVQNQNVQLQNQHQQEGLQGLSNIYNDANSTASGYLKTAEQAPPSFWQQMAMTAAGPIAKAAGGAASGAIFGG